MKPAALLFPAAMIKGHTDPVCGSVVVTWGFGTVRLTGTVWVAVVAGSTLVTLLPLVVGEAAALAARIAERASRASAVTATL